MEEMSDIGILTFQRTTNYGAALQAFALQEAIKKLGYRVNIIDYKCTEVEARELYTFPHPSKNVIQWLRAGKEYFCKRKKRKIINEFINSYMNLSERQYTKKTVMQIGNRYKKCIVGSDMVWDIKITKGDYTFFLDFATQSKNSYAASLNVKSMRGNERKAISLLRDFKNISVRECDAQFFLDNNGIKSEVVLDPTLLLTGDFWRGIESEYKLENKKYILIYFPDSDGNMLKYAKTVADKEGLTVVLVSDYKPKTFTGKVINDASVGEFLWLIDNAELVITGSYHGLVFSINFNTKFYFYCGSSGYRMESIAKILGCSDKKLTENTNYFGDKWDFETIENRLNGEREKSLNYLCRVLKDE